VCLPVVIVAVYKYYGITISVGIGNAAVGGCGKFDQVIFVSPSVRLEKYLG